MIVFLIRKCFGENILGLGEDVLTNFCIFVYVSFKRVNHEYTKFDYWGGVDGNGDDGFG
jgi:hypothetical protein